MHCGFCTATCPTYVLLGDELDSPRGRIYLIKDMLENDKPASDQIVKHIDRCLSCLSCMTTCPSGVHYMHLVDHARNHIEQTYRRPLARPPPARACWRACCPSPVLFRLALLGARLAAPFAGLLPSGLLRPLRAMLALAPARLPAPSPVDTAAGLSGRGRAPRMRVALLTGCAQQVLAPEINEATIRLLTRHGCRGRGRQGRRLLRRADPSHGQGARRRCASAARQHRRLEPGAAKARGSTPLSSTPRAAARRSRTTASCCATDPAYADKAARIGALAARRHRVIDRARPAAARSADTDLGVAYHSACSMQHGQQITAEPKALLAQAGFTVGTFAEGHLCCGSAGIYNILQPEIATPPARPQGRQSSRAPQPDVIASGNIGCMTQLSGRHVDLPVVHTVELLDWATGGPLPEALLP